MLFGITKAGDLRKKSGGYDQMNKLQKEEFRSFLNQSSSSFDFFAPAKDIEKWIKQLKKLTKTMVINHVKLKLVFGAKHTGFDVCNREFETNRQYHSTDYSP